MKLVDLHEENLLKGTESFPKIWNKNFDCRSMKLTSLKGCPEEINGDFDCRLNSLKSLKYGPTKVSGNYICEGNNLKSLIGIPQHISYLTCEKNFIESFEGIHDIVIDQNFNCSHNKIKSFKDIHKQFRDIGNHLIDGGTIYAWGCPIESHLLGLLKIKNLEDFYFDNDVVRKIMQKYLKQPFGNKRIVDCQSELLDSGFEAFAQL